MREGIFKTRREWLWLLGLSAAVGAGVTILGLLGYSVFEGAPFILAGALASFCFADLLTRVSGRRWRTVLLLVSVWVVSLLLYFALPYEWFYTDSGSLSDETFVYWLFQGASVGLAASSGTLGSALVWGEMTPQEARKRRRDSRHSLLILGGAVLGVFAVLFVLYVFLEYVLAPVLRFFL